ncbi:MAG: molybdopterin molybdotransferase MoeA [Candidatus Krumholzibacteria bacterium]|nr:molybdopterin molybdotransferase MoeA [Candidatus Krumholzibacteria bacterium]
MNDGKKNFGRGELMPFDEVMGTILGSARPSGSEEVGLDDAAGRVLAADIVSDIDMPPFDKSAMDGFACRSADLDCPLRIVETVAAGSMPEKEINEGECARIMTGAAVPRGADIVVMVEDTEEADGTVRISRQSGRSNICFLGEDVRTGDRVLEKGSLIRPAEIAVLAATNGVTAPVAVRPVLGIAVTGDELAEPGQPVSAGMIRNSNGPQLIAQAAETGLPAEYLGIVPDESGAVPDLIERASDRIDVFIFSGGVSMGDYDFVPGGLEEAGFELLVHGAAIKPGRPLLFGRREGAWVFGLPGNPVSVFVLFEIIVKPFCFRLMGHDYRPLEVTARLDKEFTRKGAIRTAHVPVRLTPDGWAQLLDYHGSAHIHAYARADGILRIPSGVDTLKEGEEVRVIIPGPPRLADGK